MRLLPALLLLFPLTLRAESPDPLRFVPDSAEFFVKIEKPRQLLDSFLKQEAVQDVLKLRAVRQILDRHEARIAFDVLGYFEKEFKSSWGEILEKLSDGGLVVAGKASDDKRSAVLILQGKDAAFSKRFADKALGVLMSELGLAEAKFEPKKETVHDVEITSLGDGFFLAVADTSLIVSTNSEAMRAAIDLHRSGGDKSLLHSARVKQARGMLPAQPLLWGWADLGPVKKIPGADEIFAQPRNNFLLTFVFAGWIDIVKRASFVTFALSESKEGYDFSLQLPAGRNNRGGDVVLHVPDAEKLPHSLPLLEPKGAIFSHSYYQDLGAMWTRRKDVFNAETAKDFENNEKEVSRFLLGTSLEKLLTQIGPYHRFVVTQPEKRNYASEPVVKLPAFGQVVALQTQEIGRSIESMLRAGGFLAYTQFGVKLVEEEMHGVPTFGYRFPEKRAYPGDEDGYRFNFAPTFALVGKQYIATSTPELCRDLIEIVKKEETTPPESRSNMRMRFLAEGVVRSILADPESAVTQSILEQGLTEKEARRETERLVEYVRKVGRFDVTTDWHDARFELQARWRPSK